MQRKILILVVVLGLLAVAYFVSSNKSRNMGLEDSSNTITPKGIVGVATGVNGKYLVDPNGLTLYVNANDMNRKDPKIKPFCDQECEKSWLPYLVSDHDPMLSKSADRTLSKLNITNRVDGSKQYFLGTQPLYRYIGDTKPGETGGIIYNTEKWRIASVL